jgi:hypothetical protein
MLEVIKLQAQSQSIKLILLFFCQYKQSKLQDMDKIDLLNLIFFRRMIAAAVVLYYFFYTLKPIHHRHI